ncbi:MAG: hypothetical protein ACRCZF_04555, partial [Gemmataceae bacterium]
KAEPKTKEKAEKDDTKKSKEKAEKDDVKKAEPKTKEKEKAEKGEVGTIEIFKGKLGLRYRIKGPDGKVVAMPLPQVAWETKEELLQALEDLKATLNKAKPVEVKD